MKHIKQKKNKITTMILILLGLAVISSIVSNTIVPAALFAGIICLAAAFYE